MASKLAHARSIVSRSMFSSVQRSRNSVLVMGRRLEDALEGGEEDEVVVVVVVVEAEVEEVVFLPDTILEGGCGSKAAEPIKDNL